MKQYDEHVKSLYRYIQQCLERSIKALEDNKAPIIYTTPYSYGHTGYGKNELGSEVGYTPRLTYRHPKMGYNANKVSNNNRYD